MKRLLLFVLLTSIFLCSESEVTSSEGRGAITLHHYIIEANGRKRDLYTFADDIQEVLAQENIKLSEKDYLSISYRDGIKYLKVCRRSEEIITEMEEIPYTEEIQYSEKLTKGFSKTIQKGKEGLKEVKYKVTLEDGAEISREKYREVIIKEPQPKVILQGMSTKAAIAAGRPTRFKEAKMMEASAYTHTGQRTFTGVYPEVGTVAVDPQVIPLGTKLWIEGYGFGVAEDTGGYIKGNRVDLFMETKRECYYWGRRQVRVLILE